MTLKNKKISNNKNNKNIRLYVVTNLEKFVYIYKITFNEK